MAGLLVALLVSLVVLWLFCRESLGVLGLWPSLKRLQDLAFGLCSAAACCTIYFLSFIPLAGTRWLPNSNFTAGKFAESSWWVLQSVLFEELLFRGALLYLAWQKLGAKGASLLSAAAFGVYHWFSMGAWGNPIQMALLFCMTGLWGYLFALAYVKTQSLYLPIGLHFGWNLLQTTVFSQGPLGEQLLLAREGEPLGFFSNLLVFLFQLLALPLVAWIYLRKTVHPASTPGPSAS